MSSRPCRSPRWRGRAAIAAAGAAVVGCRLLRDQIAALIAGVALINAANRLAVIVHQRGGGYEPGMFAATVG